MNVAAQVHRCYVLGNGVGETRLLGPGACHHRIQSLILHLVPSRHFVAAQFLLSVSDAETGLADAT